MELRPYQQDGLDQIRALYAKGVKKVLLHLPTGGGKTHIFSYAMKQTAEKGKRCLMVVRGRELVEQASQRLFREKVEHGVRMAGHWNRNYGALIQVCSIDTLRSRGTFPEADLIVIDEADQATSESYKKLAEQYPHAFFLPVTATPYSKKSLRHIAEEVVQPITVQGLIDLGYLVGPRYYAPSEPDLTGVKIVKNEYDSNQLTERMSVLTGDIVSHWRDLAGNRPTVCFAVSVAHSKVLRDSFLEQGIAAEHVDAETNDEIRVAVLGRLARGETKIVTNVGILCRGVDMPWLGCVIMARPTRSYNLFIQQAGRGTRPYAGKDDFILLDHAGNVTRHGYITVDPPADLDGTRKEGPLKRLVKVCKKCYLIYESPSCPDCGPLAGDEDEAVRRLEVNDERLKELTVREEDPILQFIAHCEKTARARKFKGGWVWHQVARRFGEDVAKQYAPGWFNPSPFVGSYYKPLR